MLDNLSTHTTPEVLAWLEKNPHVMFHFDLGRVAWLNQVEIWSGVITRQAIRRGTSSVAPSPGKQPTTSTRGTAT